MNDSSNISTSLLNPTLKRLKEGTIISGGEGITEISSTNLSKILSVSTVIFF